MDRTVVGTGWNGGKMTMTDWVPVMAPPELAERFLRDVADHLAGGRADPRSWHDATGADVADLVGGLNDDQKNLLVELAFASAPRSAAALGAALGRTVDDIAGIVGPINKRSRKLGWVSPLRSHRHAGTGGVEKVVVLDDRVSLWVRDHHEEA